MSSTPRTLIRRPSRSISTSVLALVLLALGGLGCWLLGSLLITGSRPQVLEGPLTGLEELTWADVPLIITGAALVLLGLVLLLLAIVPGSTRRIAVLGSETPGQTAMSHRDASRRIRRRAEQVDGVLSAAVRVHARSVRVDARTPLQDATRVRGSVTEAVELAVAEIRPTTPLRVRVRVRQTD